MATLIDVLGYTIDADRGFVFAVREGSRLAAIVHSLFPPARAACPDSHQVTWCCWSALANCDPVSAAYVIEQLAWATKDDSAARLAVVAMDVIGLRPLAPSPEAPHAS